MQIQGEKVEIIKNNGHKEFMKKEKRTFAKNGKICRPEFETTHYISSKQYGLDTVRKKNLLPDEKKQ